MWLWADHTTVDGSSSLFVVFDLTERWFIQMVWRILDDFRKYLQALNNLGSWDITLSLFFRQIDDINSKWAVVLYFPHFCVMSAMVKFQTWQMLLHYLSHNEFSPPPLCLPTLSSHPLLAAWYSELHDRPRWMAVNSCLFFDGCLWEHVIAFGAGYTCTH